MECATFENIRAAGYLPEMPPVGRQLRILELDESRGDSSADVIDLIARDTQLAETILRFVWSARTGQRCQVSSLSDAIGIIGLHGLKTTAFSLAVIAHEFKVDCPSFDQDRFKLHALGCGIAAQSLCRDLRWASPAEAFAAGILSQVGRLTLACAFPGDYAEVLSKSHASSSQLETLEKVRFGAPYSVISEYVLREWGLPEPLCQAIGQLGRFNDPCAVAPLPRLLRIAEVASDVICPVADSVRRDIGELVEIARCLGEVAENKCFSLASTISSELAEAIPRLGLAQVTLCDVQGNESAGRTDLEPSGCTDGTPLAQRQVELLRSASTDGLTGIANRAAFDARLTQELGRVGRYGTRIAVLLIDVDHMRLINDEEGYFAGDHALRSVGRTLAELIREVDFCARFGGDEFAIIATISSLDELVGLANRLCRAIDAFPLLWLNRNLKTTVSIGASHSSDVYDVVSASSAILRGASEQLFVAKYRGGNQSSIQSRSGPAAPRMTADGRVDAKEGGSEVGHDDLQPDDEQVDCLTPEYVEHP